MLERLQTWKDISFKKHFKVFGFRTSVYIPKERRSNLGFKTKQCIFLGYAHEEFYYRSRDPINIKIMRSIEVEVYLLPGTKQLMTLRNSLLLMPLST